MKKLLVLALAGLLLGTAALTTATPALAGKPGSSDIETYRGTVSVSAPATEQFTTYANETGVILSYQSRNGGDKTVEVFDSVNNLVASIWVPAGVTSVWSTYISVNPSATYTVIIHNSEGQTKYTLYVNHCPNGNCF